MINLKLSKNEIHGGNFMLLKTLVYKKKDLTTVTETSPWKKP